MYATHNDLVKRYGEEAVLMTFDRENLGAADSDAESAALSDASYEIDGYLAGRYSLPLAAVPPNLPLFCCDIAMYRGAKGSVVTEECRRRFDDAIRYLTKVAEGKIRLSQPDTTESQARDQMAVQAPRRMFSRRDLDRY